MSKTQLNTGRVQVGDLREVARLELLELLDRFLLPIFGILSCTAGKYPGFLVLKLLCGTQRLQDHLVSLRSTNTSRNMR